VGIWEKPTEASTLPSTDSTQQAISQSPEYKRGLVYYLGKESQIVGVVLWNVWNKSDEAKRLVKSGMIATNPKLGTTLLKHLISLEEDKEDH
jgi:hypothetical protein